MRFWAVSCGALLGDRETTLGGMGPYNATEDQNHISDRKLLK